MTTIAQEKDLALPWDYFLEQIPEVERQYVVTHIAAFRVGEWPQIVHLLAKDFQWKIPEGLEPHWVASGRAVWWQEQIYSRRVQRADGDGNLSWVMEEVNEGWKPTSPQPTNNPSQMNHYLSKGLRLRPPSEGVAVEMRTELEEAARLSEEAQQSGATPEFLCRAHQNGVRAFASWKAYLRHCGASGEGPNMDQAPDRIKRRMVQFLWYCKHHDQGFNEERLAAHHTKWEGQHGVVTKHVGLEEMEVRKSA